MTKDWVELLIPSWVKIKRNGMAAKQTLKHKRKINKGGIKGKKEEKDKERQIKDTIRKNERKYNPRWRRQIPCECFLLKTKQNKKKQNLKKNMNLIKQ